VRSYSIYKHDTTLKMTFGAIFFLDDFNSGPPSINGFNHHRKVMSSVLKLTVKVSVEAGDEMGTDILDVGALSCGGVVRCGAETLQTSLILRI
jgi:hypothetical protein